MNRMVAMSESSVRELTDRIEMMEEALHRIVRWSEAYPETVFPEPDWKKAAQSLKAGGLTLDCISAHCMKHVIEGVALIARTALDKDAGK